MTVSLSLAVVPAAPARGGVITATYTVAGAAPGAALTIAFKGDVTVNGTDYPGASGSLTLPAAASAVSYAVPTCPGLTFKAGSSPNVFTATVPAGAPSGPAVVSGVATVGGTVLAATAPVTLPAGSTPPPPPPPPPSGTVPYPAALATGHTLVSQYLPNDLYAWRFLPGTQIPVTNGGGVSEDPNSPRNVTVETDGGLSVLKLATKNELDCGVIQSPGTYPTASGVVEALVKFSGFNSNGSAVFAGWSSFWMYGPQWPQQGEIDAVETQYGNSFVSYHYGSGSSSQATTDPWTYPAKTVQLTPKNSTTAPAVPNILPDTWTYVTLAFGKDASGNKVDVYYNGTLYCTISGAYVTGQPMFITAGTSFGGPVLGSNQTPYDQPGNIEIQWIRVFS